MQRQTSPKCESPRLRSHTGRKDRAHDLRSPPALSEALQPPHPRSLQPAERQRVPSAASAERSAVGCAAWCCERSRARAGLVAIPGSAVIEDRTQLLILGVEAEGAKARLALRVPIPTPNADPDAGPVQPGGLFVAYRPGKGHWPLVRPHGDNIISLHLKKKLKESM